MSTVAYAIWRKNGLVWLALLMLLVLTFGVAHLPLGDFNVVAGLAIAGIKAALVALIFMGLGRSASLVRLAAAAGLLWLVILFTLTLADVAATRHPPSAHENASGGREQSLPSELNRQE